MESDYLDGIICRKLLNVIEAVKSYYNYKYDDITVKKEVGLISEEQYLKELREGKHFIDTKRYYESLCTDELRKIGLVSSNACFDKVFYFNQEILDEMCQIEYQDLAPYITKYLIPQEQYVEIKEKLKDEMEIENELEQN